MWQQARGLARRPSWGALTQSPGPLSRAPLHSQRAQGVGSDEHSAAEEWQQRVLEGRRPRAARAPSISAAAPAVALSDWPALSHCSLIEAAGSAGGLQPLPPAVRSPALHWAPALRAFQACGASSILIFCPCCRQTGAFCCWFGPPTNPQERQGMRLHWLQAGGEPDGSTFDGGGWQPPAGTIDGVAMCLPECIALASCRICRASWCARYRFLLGAAAGRRLAAQTHAAGVGGARAVPFGGGALQRGQSLLAGLACPALLPHMRQAMAALEAPGRPLGSRENRRSWLGSHAGSCAGRCGSCTWCHRPRPAAPGGIHAFSRCSRTPRTPLPFIRARHDAAPGAQGERSPAACGPPPDDALRARAARRPLHPRSNARGGVRRGAWELRMSRWQLPPRWIPLSPPIVGDRSPPSMPPPAGAVAAGTEGHHCRHRAGQLYRRPGSDHQVAEQYPCRVVQWHGQPRRRHRRHRHPLQRLCGLRLRAPG